MNIFEFCENQRNYFFSWANSRNYTPLTSIFSNLALQEGNGATTEELKRLLETIKPQYINAGPEWAADLLLALNMKTFFYYEISKKKATKKTEWASAMVEHIGGEEVATTFFNFYLQEYNALQTEVNNTYAERELNTLWDIVDP